MAVVLEQLMLEYGLRCGHYDLVAELFQDVRCRNTADVHWLLAALNFVVKNRLYGKYPTACKIIDLLHRTCPDELMSDDQYFQHTFLMLLLNLLSRVGNETTAAVVKLMNDTFGPMPDDEEDRAQSSQIYFGNSVRRELFKSARCFVLKLLLKNKRTENFARKKFPQTFVQLEAAVEEMTRELLERAWHCLPEPKLKMIARSQSLEDAFSQEELKLDPALLLYLESFPAGKEPTQDELMTFLGTVRSSQMSLTPPDFAHNVKLENFGLQQVAEEDVLTASDDLFATPPDLRRVSPVDQHMETHDAQPEPVNGRVEEQLQFPYNQVQPCEIKLMRLEDTIYRHYLVKK